MKTNKRMLHIVRGRELLQFRVAQADFYIAAQDRDRFRFNAARGQSLRGRAGFLNSVERASRAR